MRTDWTTPPRTVPLSGSTARRPRCRNGTIVVALSRRGRRDIYRRAESTATRLLLPPRVEAGGLLWVRSQSSSSSPTSRLIGKMTWSASTIQIALLAEAGSSAAVPQDKRARLIDSQTTDVVLRCAASSRPTTAMSQSPALAAQRESREKSRKPTRLVMASRKPDKDAPWLKERDFRPLRAWKPTPGSVEKR